MDAVAEAKAVWPGASTLVTVQEILDANKVLVAEIDRNHELRTPDALHRNCALIRELNANVAKVVSLYEEISKSFVELVDGGAAPPSASGGGPAAAAAVRGGDAPSSSPSAAGGREAPAVG